MKTGVFLYNSSQVDQLPTLLSAVGSSESYDLVAFGADIESLLAEKGMKFVSVREMRKMPTPERLILAKEVGERVLNDGTFSFFSHNTISLARLHTPALQYYLGVFFYYIDIVRSISERYEKIVISEPSSHPGPAASILELYNATVVVDSARVISQQRNIGLRIVRIKASQNKARTLGKQKIFEIKRAIFGALLSLHNAYVRVRVPEKTIRILGSELWKNIAPLMKEFSEAELVLLDRTEFFSLKRTELFRNRVQFVQFQDFISRKAKTKIWERQKEFFHAWESIREGKPSCLRVEFEDLDLTSHLTQVVERIITEGGRRALNEIEGSAGMLALLKPHLVLVRAGISAQTHFGSLCESARRAGIPSLEVQHGILSVFKGDLTNNPHSEYIAEYGPLVRTELETYGFAPRSRFVDVGSPRFDDYRYLKEEKSNDSSAPRLLHIGPPLYPGGWNDSYDVIDYFESLAKAVSDIPDIQITIKLRATRAEEDFYRGVIKKAFGSTQYRIAIFEPLAELLSQTDIVVSCHSTAFLEAMIAHKAVIVDATLPIYSALAKADLASYFESRAVMVAWNEKELKESVTLLAQDKIKREILAQNAGEFVDKNFLLSDGKSSMRLAEAIRKITNRPISG
jgi:hypothetical protein